MIVKILHGSPDFHAVRYNDRKVAEGVARLIEKKDFWTLDEASTDDRANFLKLYSSRNGRIKNAQFHVTVSCKGHEKSEPELLDFAHRWLKEMGYMEPEQPILIYSHQDTDNNHLHIVTSRVAPNGKKINDSHEQRRSQAIMERLLNTNRKEQTDIDIEKAKQYKVSSLAQFKAVMQTMGNYEVYEKDGTVYIKYGGSVRQRFPLSDISDKFISPERDKERCRWLRNRLLQHIDAFGTKRQRMEEMKQQYGIEVKFYGKKNNPNGYMLVDHKNLTVYNGSKILATEELVEFERPEERFKAIEDYIDQLFINNPKITQREINKMLRRYRAEIKKGVIYCRGRSKPLYKDQAEYIYRNNRVMTVEKFRPKTEAERDLLCKLLNVDCPELVSLSVTRNKNYKAAIDQLREIFSDKHSLDVGEKAKEAGFCFILIHDVAYAVIANTYTIVNLSEEGFDINRINWEPMKPEEKRPSVKKTLRPKIRAVDGGSRSENREWEVGKKDEPEEETNRGRLMKW